MTKKITFLLVVSLMIPAGLILAAGGDAAAGKAVYGTKCASCHGPNGEGKDAIAKALKVELRNLGSKEVQAKSDADLGKDSSKGVGKMKPTAGLSDADVANVVAFLRTLAKK